MYDFFCHSHNIYYKSQSPNTQRSAIVAQERLWTSPVPYVLRKDLGKYNYILNITNYVHKQEYLIHELHLNCPPWTMEEMNAKGVILRAFEQFRLKSCIDFKPRDSEDYYISVQKLDGYVLYLLFFLYFMFFVFISLVCYSSLVLLRLPERCGWPYLTFLYVNEPLCAQADGCRTDTMYYWPLHEVVCSSCCFDKWGLWLSQWHNGINVTVTGEHFFHFRCFSYIGQSALNGQVLSIGRYCDQISTVEHEFLHALGFYHEHARYDRDDYVTIAFENIQQGFIKTFIIIFLSFICVTSRSYYFPTCQHLPFGMPFQL